MSIQSVNSRIAELQARIAGFMPDPPAAPIVQPAAQPQSPLATGSAQPFNVALAAANGQASVVPASGGLTPNVEDLVQKYSAKNGLDPNVVRAVIKAESDGDTRSVSSVGAKGLMQLMPSEVSEYGLSDPFDPEQNIAGGTRQLADKLKLFGGNLPLALAAYN